MVRALSFLLFLPVMCFGQFTRKVIKVTDGDTYKVKGASREIVSVGLYGIDWPESS
jgi:endonuclease YncB( thermonuclease family)